MRAYADWQQGMPESRRFEPGNARLAPGQSPQLPGESCGIGYAGESADAQYAEGLETWQKWYEARGYAVPTIAPGSELEVRANLNADHGGQAWFAIACSDRIGEDINWLLLERAASDREHHYMPSNPKIYAWAFGDVNTDGERSAVIIARWLVPESFSCPTEQAVGRWVWKVANTCVDADNLGINTESFSLTEYEAVVENFKPGQNVQGKCSSSPEQFLSCFVFKVDSSDPTTSVAAGSTTSKLTVTSTTTTTITPSSTITTSTLVTSTVLLQSCEPIDDCSSLSWCDQDGFKQWCMQEGEAGTCPEAFCRYSVASPSPVTTSGAPSPSPATTTTPTGQCPNTANAQCGGIGFIGESCCPASHYCKEVSEWWSQCYSCQYFPDAACGSLPGMTAKRHKFLGISLMQDGAMVARLEPTEPKTEL